MTSIYQVLSELGIQYQQHLHPAVHTVADAEKYDQGGEVWGSKNLFLRNKKGSQFYLVIIASSKRADLAHLAAALGESSLSFASSEKLALYLGVTPGAVSPFGLIHDTAKKVIVVIDADIQHQATQAFHPNVNTETLTLSTTDFQKFLSWSGQQVRYIAM